LVFTFRDEIRAPIPQRNETLVEDVPAFGRLLYKGFGKGCIQMDEN
jgi:hypothetical protein